VEKHMPVHPIALPPIPDDTAKAARNLFGEGNIYIRLGEHLNELFIGIGQMKMEIHGERSAEAIARYAVMTAFQYAEELTDYQMVEAIRSRADLKYALHLPVNYPGFDPLALCEFHQRLYTDPSSRLTYQELVDRLTEFGLLKAKEGQTLLVLHMLEAICTSTRRQRVVEAMYQALEALTITNTEWLRQITLPHWYERYSRRKRITFWLNGKGEWITMTQKIGTDIQYLLGEIDRSHQPAITSLREVQLLRKVCEEHFEVSNIQTTHVRPIQWRHTGCASCIR
jgi:transposase